MILSFHPCITADQQVILGSRSPGLKDAALAARAEAVVLPQTCGEALYRICREAGAPCFPAYDLRFAYPGKAGQAGLFSERGLPHPRTLVWASADALRESIRGSGSPPHHLPFLVKTDTDHEGRGIRLIHGPEDLDRALKDLSRRKPAEAVLTQDLIPAGGNVLRAVILGQTVRTYWKRASGPEALVSTVARGARIDEVWRGDLQERGRRMAAEIREALGIDLAAVDMVFDMACPDPEPLILEINYVFGRRGLGGSEAFYRLLFEAVCAWLEQRGLDSSRVGLV